MIETYEQFSSLRFENNHPGVLELVFDGRADHHQVQEPSHARGRH